MSQPLGRAPQRVRVRDGQVLPLADRLPTGPDQQAAVAGESLRTVGHAAVLQHGAGVVDGHVRGLGQRHFVPVHLDDPADPEDLVGRELGRVQSEEPAQVVDYPDPVRLVLGPAAAPGAVRLQISEFGPHFRVVLFLVQAPDYRDRLITRVGNREIFDLNLSAQYKGV